MLHGFLHAEDTEIPIPPFPAASKNTIALDQGFL
jgi:hypothetical protein